MSENTRLDWAEARARLARIGESLQKTVLHSAEERERIFRIRAELLARPVASPDASSLNLPGATRVMVFRLGAALYALPLDRIAEVLPDSKPALAPGAPPEIVGLIQVRGEVRPVWDLRRLLGLPPAGERQTGPILLLRAGSREIGVQVDLVEDLRSIGPEERRPAPPGSHAAWLTGDLIAVLDMDSLFEKQREGL